MLTKSNLSFLFFRFLLPFLLSFHFFFLFFPPPPRVLLIHFNFFKIRLKHQPFSVCFSNFLNSIHCLFICCRCFWCNLNFAYFYAENNFQLKKKQWLSSNKIRRKNSFFFFFLFFWATNFYAKKFETNSILAYITFFFFTYSLFVYLSVFF